MVLLADQDRALWDRALIEEGQAIVRALLRRNTPGPFQIQAAINAVHSDAPVAARTDWSQSCSSTTMLLAHTPTPIVALNRAVAVAEVDGPAAALAESRRSTCRSTTCSTRPVASCSCGCSGLMRRRRPWQRLWS